MVYVGVSFEGVSFLVCLGLGKSFAKWFSPQLKHFILGLDLCKCVLHSTVLCDLKLCIEHHLGDEDDELTSTIYKGKAGITSHGYLGKFSMCLLLRRIPYKFV